MMTRCYTAMDVYNIHIQMRADYEYVMKIGDRREYLTKTLIDKPTSGHVMPPEQPAQGQIITNESHEYKMQV